MINKMLVKRLNIANWSEGKIDQDLGGLQTLMKVFFQGNTQLNFLFSSKFPPWHFSFGQPLLSNLSSN